MTRLALALIAVVVAFAVIGVVGLAISVAKVVFVGFAVLFLASIALSVIREHRQKLNRDRHPSM